MVSVFVLEPQAERRSQLVAGLAHTPRLQVVGQAATYAALFQALREHSAPQVLVVNFAHLTPELSAWGPVRVRLPEAQLVGLCPRQDPQRLLAVSGLNPAGLLQLDVDLATLAQALKLVPHGQRVWDPELLQVAHFWTRRVTEQTPAPAPELTIDLGQASVHRGPEPIALSPLEFKVLTYLAEHAEHVLSPAELLTQVWACPHPHGGTPAQVKCCIQRLRRKLEPDRSQPHYIQTVWGRGYRLAVQPRVKNGRTHPRSLAAAKN